MLDASFSLNLERLQLSPDDVERRKAFVGLQSCEAASLDIRFRRYARPSVS